MFTDKVLPFTFEGWDVLDQANNLVFFKAKMLRPFGDWKDNELCAVMKVFYSEGKIEEWTTDGKLLKTLEFDIIAKTKAEKPKGEPVAA